MIAVVTGQRREFAEFIRNINAEHRDLFRHVDCIESVYGIKWTGFIDLYGARHMRDIHNIFVHIQQVRYLHETTNEKYESLGSK